MYSSDLIVNGSKNVKCSLPKYTNVGQFLTENLKKRQADEIINIDAITGDSQTCGKLLEDTVKAIRVLKNLGIHKDDVIALISENAIDYNVPMLAAFSIGAIVNLLNPGYSIEELRHAFSMSKPKIILCSATAVTTAETLKTEFDIVQVVLINGKSDNCKNDQLILNFKELLSEICDAGCIDYVAESFDTSQQGALILMSSGSTGLPKGVLLTHQNIGHAVYYMAEPKHIGLKKGDTLLLILPIFHIFGLKLYLVSLLCPIKVVVFQKLQLSLFLKSIELYKVRTLQLVPTLVSIFANETAIKNYDVTSIQEIVVGGSPFSNTAAENVIQRLPNIRFREIYGLTEVSGMCAFVGSYPKKENCIGSLLSEIQGKVWDSVLRHDVGCMQVGELCFRGSTIMKGYLGLPNDESVIDKDGFYHSGDMGYYDDEGDFYIVDRIKELIKYKEFQVSPVELERLLLSHSEIKDCAVIGIPDDIVGQLPLACVVRKPNSTVTEKEIVDFVAERISVQKHLHGGVRFVYEIPKSSSGKILRRKIEGLLSTNKV